MLTCVPKTMPRMKVHLAFQASVHTLYSNNKKWTFKIEHSHEIPCWQGVTSWPFTNRGFELGTTKKQIQIAIGVGTRTWDCACRIVCLECWSYGHATSFSWVYCAGLIHMATTRSGSYTEYKPHAVKCLLHLLCQGQLFLSISKRFKQTKPSQLLNLQLWSRKVSIVFGL